MERLILQVSFEGEITKFSWIVPLPSYPALDRSTASLFMELHHITAPKYQRTGRAMAGVIFGAGKVGGGDVVVHEERQGGQGKLLSRFCCLRRPMPEYRVELKMPKSRIAVLIGPKGEVKKQVEEATRTRITIDSSEGDVTLTSKDSIGLYQTKEIVTAIARGFSPEHAMLLLHPDYMLDMLDLKDYSKTKNSMIRLKGRVIGSEGKSRKVIEELTETNICVFGKTISLIGRAENVALARHAVGSLLKGSPHSTVYRWLERQRRLFKTRKAFIVDESLAEEGE